jgi:H+-transporting ATPase
LVLEGPAAIPASVSLSLLITLLNDGTLIAIGYDNVEPQQTPTVWNLRVLFAVGIVLAAVACASSLLLLSMSLHSWQEGSVYQLIGIGGLSYGQITTSIYLKVSVSDFLTLFSARAGEKWFWTSTPAPVLLAAGSLALMTSTVLACLWPMSKPDGIPTLGLLRRGHTYGLPVYIWLYCIFWWFIQDAAKVYLYRFMKHYNVFGYNDTGMVENLPHPVVANPLAPGHGLGHGPHHGGVDMASLIATSGEKLKNGITFINTSASAPTLPTSIYNSTKSNTPIKKGI